MGPEPPGAQGPCGDAPPILFCLGKRECAAPGGRENRFDEQEDRMVLLFVITGVVRNGPAEIDGPVDPAPDLSREELHLRIRWGGARTGWKPESAYFCSRAFRFATRCRGGR